MAFSRALLSAVLIPLMGSCSTGHFFLQAAKGQFEILSRSRPLAVVKNDPATPPNIRSQLILAERLVEFAGNELSLHPGTAYSAYADLGREHVLWNIFAAPELSLTAKEWRYPIVGKLDYRGYFKETSARQVAQDLEDDGYDTVVGGVDAYSTLGWFRDPLLNTFIEDREILLAELIFHELTHRRLFRKGETAFNEALATAVSYEGVRRWLQAEGKSDQLADYALLLTRRAEFYAHVERTSGELRALYASSRTRAEKLRHKTELLAALQDDFRTLHRRWGSRGGDYWLAKPLNNAHLVASATYREHLPLFGNLLKIHHQNLDRFFRAAKKLPKIED